MARRTARSTNRTGSDGSACAPDRDMDRGIARNRSGYVALRLCGALQFAGGAATDAVPGDVAHAYGGAVLARGARQPGPDWHGHWLRFRIGVQPCLQAPIRLVTKRLASAIGVSELLLLESGPSRLT